MSEAFNLLNKSIIRVEQPDVNLDDDDDDELLSRIPETDGSDELNSFNCFYLLYLDHKCLLGMDVDVTEEPDKRSLTKKKLTLAFDEYKRITNMIVVYMRSEEENRIIGMYFVFIIK